MVLLVPVEGRIEGLAEAAKWAAMVLHSAYRLHAMFARLGLRGVRWLWAHLVSSVCV